MKDGSLLIVDAQKGNVKTKEDSVLQYKLEWLLRGPKFDRVIASNFKNTLSSVSRQKWGIEGMLSDEDREFIGDVAYHAEAEFIHSSITSLTPELQKYIESHDIKKLYLAGLGFNRGIIKTAYDLIEMGVQPVILLNYCGQQLSKEFIEPLKTYLGEEAFSYGV